MTVAAAFLLIGFIAFVAAVVLEILFPRIRRHEATVITVTSPTSCELSDGTTLTCAAAHGWEPGDRLTVTGLGGRRAR